MVLGSEINERTYESFEVVLCVCVSVFMCLCWVTPDLSQCNRPDGPCSVASDPRQLFQKALHRPGHLSLHLCHHLTHRLQ